MSVISDMCAEIGAVGIDLIDIGSSGALDGKWASIKSLINLVGFDPNAAECERQNQLPSKCRSSIFLPYAVHAHDGVETLYRTRSIYCYSILKPDKAWIDRFAFRQLFDVMGEEPITVRAIDGIEELSQRRPDAIKIDVQGVELPILRRAGRLLDSAFFVETETGLTQQYIGETTFSQLDAFMQSNGFLMFDMNTSHRIARDNPLQQHPNGREQILWAEAVWLKDYVALDRQGKFDASSFDAVKAKKILILCAMQKCRDFGYELAGFFHHKGLVAAQELRALAKPEAWHLPSGVDEDRPEHSLAVRALTKALGLLPYRIRMAIHKASKQPR